MRTQDWKRLVIRHARATAGHDLPQQTIDELAEHLEDIYLDALGAGCGEAGARRRAEAALAESPLAAVPRPRTRPDIATSRLAESGHGLTGIWRDARFAWRQLRRAPSFAVVAVLTLGLGAGAATAIFSVVNAVLLRPLPYREPSQLVSIWDANAEKALARERISPVTFMDERNLRTVFEDAAAWWRPEVNLAAPGTEPVRVSAIETSANLFELLDVSPQLGAGFPRNGPMHSRDGIAVISDRLWRSRYNADASIVGKRLDTKDGDYTIAGVMPPGFTFPDDVDLWLRLNWDLTRHSRGAHFMEAVARLRAGVGVDQAARELASLSARLGKEFPATNRGWIARPFPLLDDMLGYYRPALLVLMAAVTLLLLTACLNVASLLLARASVRAREMAVRAALGASRGRLLGQMLVEAVMLAALGAAAGVAVAAALLKLAVAAAPVAIPRLADARLDLPVLAFAVAVVGVAAIAFGLLPALLVSRADPAGALKDVSRAATGSRHRWNRALVVAEVALAAAVLVASTLLVQSVNRMLGARTGVVPAGVVTGALQVSSKGYRDWNAVDRFYATLLDAVRRQPGVQGVGASNAPPLVAGWRIPFAVEGQAGARSGEETIAQHVSVTSGYFETFRATLVRGRLFTDDDRANTQPVVVVNSTFARRFFAGQDAVGRRIVSTAVNVGPLGRNLAGTVPFTIIGVVADVQQVPLGQRGEPVIYHSARQFPFRAMTVAARGTDTVVVTTAIRTALRSVDPSLPLSDVRTMPDRLRANAAAPRLLMFVLTAFAILAGALSAIGVYGLLACVVNERRRELAIRLALGASPVSLARLVTVQGMVLAMLGVVVGVSAAQACAGLLERVLFETRTTDAAALGATALILLLAAVAACLAPAWRAARVAPVEGLKSET